MSASSADLDKMDKGSMPNGHSPATNGNKRADQPAAKLTFLREDREKFDMPDLLKASAEVLGGGMFGSTYKAALSVGSVMVVKRFRHMNNVGKEEYQEHMRRLGRLRHSNLLPLVAFYYRKEEKLLVSDYVNNVSLAIHLHGMLTSPYICIGFTPFKMFWSLNVYALLKFCATFGKHVLVGI